MLDNIWDTLLRENSPTDITSSKLTSQHDKFYTQVLKVKKDIANYNRHDFFASVVKNKKVLHVGCTDYPFCNASDGHLHIHLDKYASKLDGFDVDTDGFKILQPKVKGKFYSDWNSITDQYDIIIATEVIEHVGNVEEFIKNLDKINSKYLFVSIPDAFSCMKGHFEYLDNSETFIEIVHSDHNAWYSPYTIKNSIEKYSTWKIKSLWFFYGRSILAICSKD